MAPKKEPLSVSPVLGAMTIKECRKSWKSGGGEAIPSSLSNDVQIADFPILALNSFAHRG